ncbi:hypothetical protein KASIA_p135 [Shewanella phage vB_SspS_KASIA]|nr:hypothetical protein KASIA_p135 [Shewanella phage vB_SspS_KASIA]
MQEVMLYGITKEPIFCLHGDRLQVYEYTTPADKPYPCSDGKYLVGDINKVVDVKSIPIHTLVLNKVDHDGVRHRTERRIALTSELIKEIGGNPVELNETIRNLNLRNEKLCKDIDHLEGTMLLLKSNLSTASFWKRLKWVFTGVEV